MRRAIPGEPGECFEWPGECDRNGYGQVRVAADPPRKMGARSMTHILAYEYFVGPVPDGLELLHSCDNPPCWNPDHLTADTHAANMRQVAERARSPRGEGHYAAKFTTAQILEIRQLCDASRRANGRVRDGIYDELAVQFNSTRESIRCIARGLNWRHV